MRTIKILGLMLLATTLLILSCSKDNDENTNLFPQGIEAFAMKHYPNNKVIKIKEVIFGKTKTYEVKLEGDIELKFNSEGELIEVESKTRIPDSLIPAKIRDYVALHYPDNFIIEWELEDDKQEVKLDNDVELEFERDSSSADYAGVIPDGIAAFLNKHFPETKVRKIVKVNKLNIITYDVELAGDIELEFNENMEIIEMESKTKLPDSVIPSKILDYVVLHYPDNFIVEWELEDDKQEVKLDNGIELEFTLNGDFIKTDTDSYTGRQELSYIVQDQVTGTVYARTISGHFISSSGIQLITPGSIVLLSYHFTEKSKQITVNENVVAYVVDLLEEPQLLDQTPLQMSLAPAVPVIKFENLMEPIFAKNEYFGDRWIFTYSLIIKKGESVKINFYKGSYEDAMASNSDVLIDVRLEKTGIASDPIGKLETNIIGVDMSSLRKLMGGRVDTNGKLSIKFRYYKSDNENIYITRNVYHMNIPS